MDGRKRKKKKENTLIVCDLILGHRHSMEHDIISTRTTAAGDTHTPHRAGMVCPCRGPHRRAHRLLDMWWCVPDDDGGKQTVGDVHLLPSPLPPRYLLLLWCRGITAGVAGWAWRARWRGTTRRRACCWRITSVTWHSLYSACNSMVITRAIHLARSSFSLPP